MKWSKVKDRVKETLCDELRDRIDFHVAVYRKSHDSDKRRGWITIDGEQAASWSCFEQLKKVMLSQKRSLNGIFLQATYGQ